MENLIEALTAKNKEYIHAVTKQLMLLGKSDDDIKNILNDILPQILEAQKTGMTARKLLGAPTTFVEQYQPKTAEKVIVDKNENPGLMWLDSTLLFIAFISLLNGIMSLASHNYPTYGLITIIVSGAIAGLVMYLMYRFFYRPQADGARRWSWKGMVATVVAVLIWFGVTVASSTLPHSINLELPSLALIVMGAVVFGIRWLLKRQFNIQSALTSRVVRDEGKS